MSAASLDQVRIVLVRTQGPLNLGAACRAMANMGLSQLVLVAPDCDPADEQARAFAMRGKHLLTRARIVPTIEEALDGCVLTYAATGKKGAQRDQAAESSRAAARRVTQVAAGGPVAIAFGPEDRGLLKHEVLCFDRVLEIEAAGSYPVLNLAAAVLVVCYDLHGASRGPTVSDGPPDPARDEQKRVLYEKLFDALDRIGFFSRQQTSEHLRFALRRIFGRVEMSVRELDVLIGVASQLHWYADQARLEFRAPGPESDTEKQP